MTTAVHHVTETSFDAKQNLDQSLFALDKKITKINQKLNQDLAKLN